MVPAHRPTPKTFIRWSRQANKRYTHTILKHFFCLKLYPSHGKSPTVNNNQRYNVTILFLLLWRANIWLILNLAFTVCYMRGSMGWELLAPTGNVASPFSVKNGLSIFSSSCMALSLSGVFTTGSLPPWLLHKWKAPSRVITFVGS